jgi:anti-sigma-K factor RskA
MIITPTPSSGTPSHNESHHPVGADDDPYQDINLREMFARLARGLIPTLGLAALGLAIGAVIYLASSPSTSATTSMRVAFAFSGSGKGEYPDHSKFQPEDVCAPDVIVEALKRQGLDSTGDFQGKVLVGLAIEGIIPSTVIKERDRLRTAGQTLAAYIPDEYLVTLTLPRKFPLTTRQRELLLNQIISVYRDQFQHTYAEVPLAFGNAFATLRNADYSEYDLVLAEEMQNITDFLRQQLSLDKNEISTSNFNSARTFRSRTTNLSFSDLLEQTRLFTQINLNETLGLIYQNGLSRNRTTALMKMDYHLRTLEDREQKAIEEEKVVDDLLAKSQDRSQNYVLGIKSQAAQQRPESPILDQGLIDSLLANDAYNFLVRKALDAGLAVKDIQAEKAQLFERRKNMETFLKNDGENQSAIIAQVQKSLSDLQTSYEELIANIRRTQADFAKQQFSDAIRISMQPVTDGKFRPLAMAGAVGAFIGLALGLGLSLLGIYVGSRR